MVFTHCVVGGETTTFSFFFRSVLSSSDCDETTTLIGWGRYTKNEGCLSHTKKKEKNGTV